MRVSHLIVSGVVLLCLRGGAALANPHLTLKDVAQKVVLTNPEVLAKWHALKAAGGDVDVARAGFFPRIDYTYATGKEDLQQPGVADRDYNRNGRVLTLNQMLYDGFATSSDVKRLDKARLTRYFELLDAVEAAALEAGRAYYDVIRYRQLMLLAEANYIEHRSSYELLLRRAQSGAGRRVDVENAAGRLALAELNLNTEAANLHDVTARYLRLVGERPLAVMFGPVRLERSYPASEDEALRQADAFVLDESILAGLLANSADAGELKLLQENFGFEPYAIAIRREDPEFKKLVDDTLVAMMKSGEFERIYNKWLMAPIPPNNHSLQMPMGEMPREQLRNSNDSGI